MNDKLHPSQDKQVGFEDQKDGVYNRSIFHYY